LTSILKPATKIWLARMFAHWQRDVLVLMASRGVRAFAFSYLTIIFAIYLNQLGFSTVTVGLVLSTASASAAVMTALWGYLSDRYGRKTILMLLAALTIVSNTIYIVFPEPMFIFLAVIIANVGAGGSGGGGAGGGPFNPVEQAFLAEKCTPENRNRIFSTNYFVGSVMSSLGALVSGLPQYLQQSWDWDSVTSFKPLFALTIIFSIGLICAYASIREHHIPRARERKLISRQSGGFITKMSLLGIIDNLGSGMIGPLLSYWLFLNFAMELKSLGLMFSFSYLFAALSFLAAPLIARRFGIVRTMAFSHGVASAIYLLLPFAPTFMVASALLVARSFLAYMDNPLRSSFIMGVVRPEDRGSAAGITSLTRHVPVAVSPTLSAYLMQAFSLNVPLVVGGLLQVFHDCVFYYLFRAVKPPEEQKSELRIVKESP
jgi:MFS family permease